MIKNMLLVIFTKTYEQLKWDCIAACAWRLIKNTGKQNQGGGGKEFLLRLGENAKSVVRRMRKVWILFRIVIQIFLT